MKNEQTRITESYYRFMGAGRRRANASKLPHHQIRLAIYKSALNITDGIQREIEERLVQSIQDRWEYIDK